MALSILLFLNKVSGVNFDFKKKLHCGVSVRLKDRPRTELQESLFFTS